MRYIRVFSSDTSGGIQQQINTWNEKQKHKILDQCSSVAITEVNGFTRKEYLLTVTFDDGARE